MSISLWNIGGFLALSAIMLVTSAAWVYRRARYPWRELAEQPPVALDDVIVLQQARLPGGHRLVLVDACGERLLVGCSGHQTKLVGVLRPAAGLTDAGLLDQI